MLARESMSGISLSDALHITGLPLRERCVKLCNSDECSGVAYALMMRGLSLTVDSEVSVTPDVVYEWLRKLVIGSTVIAIKLMEDEYYNNSVVASIFCNSLEYVNEAEWIVFARLLSGSSLSVNVGSATWALQQSFNEPSEWAKEIAAQLVLSKQPSARFTTTDCAPVTHTDTTAERMLRRTGSGSFLRLLTLRKIWREGGGYYTSCDR